MNIKYYYIQVSESIINANTCLLLLSIEKNKFFTSLYFFLGSIRYLDTTIFKTIKVAKCFNNSYPKVPHRLSLYPVRSLYIDTNLEEAPCIISLDVIGPDSNSSGRVIQRIQTVFDCVQKL